MFDPGYNQKMLIRLQRQSPFWTEFVLLMNSSFIQYNAALEQYVNVPQKISSFCQMNLVFCHYQLSFNISEVQKVSATLHDIIGIVGISLEV